MVYDFIIGVDPGNSGGIAIIDCTGNINVHRIPIKTSKKSNGKNKTEYDLNAIVNILNKCFGKVLFVLENVSVMPSDGAVSAYAFGKGIGQLEGVAVALGFQLEKVHPVTWKNHFPNLESAAFKDIKDKIDLIKSKTKKGSIANKSNDKELSKLKKLLKPQAKDDARVLAASLYPNICNGFKLKRDDGLAESVLMAKYGLDKF